MDYEKMYKAVLETAKQWFKDSCSDKVKTCLECIFPELRESEDERIRKLLVWQVHRNIEDETNDLAQSVYDGIKGHDPDLEESIEDWKKCLAYLEKQKEPHYTKRNALFDKCVENCDPEVMKEVYDKVDEMLGKEQKPDIELIQRSWYMEGYHDREFDKEPKWIIKTGEGGPKHELNPKYGEYIKKEQKPAEWSEEDELKMNALLKYLNPDAGGTKYSSYAQLTEWYNWLKSLKDRGNFPKSNTNSPSEWSEEDEDMIQGVISDLECLKDWIRKHDKGCGGTMVFPLINKRIDWLKSLRNRPKSSDTWKPSEEH